MKYLVLLLSLSITFLSPRVASADVSSLLIRIKTVGREGQGNVEAIKAWQELVKQGPAALPAVLTGMNDADPTALNWLRAAVETIADQAISTKQPLPADQLELFVKDTKHSGASRRLAYEVLQRIDPSASTRLIPGMLNDPSQELRRDAVELAIKEAGALTDPAATTSALQKAFAAARDRDQVDAIAERLKKLGVEVDLAKHFGFVRQWMLVTPFDNRGGVGFAAIYPPEKGVDLSISYDGKEGTKAAWKESVSTDPYGWVDLNKVIGPLKGTVAYAYTVIDSPTEQAVQVRAGSPNALKMFLNGKQIFFREEYHHGSRTDTHVGKGVLKPGRNELMLKVCQNEQTESWAQEWKFQLRICDDIGGAVPVSVGGKK
jgi:hypothetical protein